MKITESPSYLKLRAWASDNRYGLKVGAIWAAVFTAFVVLIVILWAVFLRTHEEIGTLSNRSWERQTELEMYRALQESRWDSAPSGAYNVSVRSEVRSYTQVLVGYTSCGKNCSTPIYVSIPNYDNRYYYMINRWVTSRWMVSRGNEVAPYWPDLPNNLSTVEQLGSERQGNETKEDYKFTVSCDGCNSKPITFELADWTRLANGSRVTAHVNSRGTIRGVEV